MIRALIVLGTLWWGFPIAGFAVVALLNGKPELFLAITALALASIFAGAIGIIIAYITDEDAFEFAVGGAIIGLVAGAWPIAELTL
jgi:VIT1/CCC1 family predicted Fe2+/Mn2+ transporter